MNPSMFSPLKSPMIPMPMMGMGSTVSESFIGTMPAKPKALPLDWRDQQWQAQQADPTKAPGYIDPRWGKPIGGVTRMGASAPGGMAPDDGYRIGNSHMMTPAKKPSIVPQQLPAGAMTDAEIFGPGGAYPPAIPRRAGGGPVQAQQDVLVGDKPGDPLTNDQIFGPGGAYPPSAPRPELLVTPDGAQVVGANGPEIVRPAKSGVIIPNPQSVAELNAMPRPRPRPKIMPTQQTGTHGPLMNPMTKRVEGAIGEGASYSVQPRSAPQGMPIPSRGALRKFANTPQGIAFIQGQQADEARQQDYLNRDQQRFDRSMQADQAQRDQAKADKLAEDERANRASLEMAKALSGKDSILQPGDFETLAGIGDAKSRNAAMETIIRLRMDERDRAEKNKPDVIGTMPLTGTDAVAITRNGQLFNVTSNAKTAAPELSPEQIQQLEAAGYSVTRKVGNATISKPQARAASAPEVRNLPVQQTNSMGQTVSVDVPHQFDPQRNGWVPVTPLPPQSAAPGGTKPQGSVSPRRSALEQAFGGK